MMIVQFLQKPISEWLLSKLFDPSARRVDNDWPDDRLLEVLDEPRLWMIRGGRAGMLGGMNDNLRIALSQTLRLSFAGEAPGPIVRMPSDEVVIRAPQIYRLWQRLGLLEMDQAPSGSA
jgi:hypothetical protein